MVQKSIISKIQYVLGKIHLPEFKRDCKASCVETYLSLKKKDELPEEMILECIYMNCISYYQDFKRYINSLPVMRKMAVSKIENWFLECKFNPKYAYCRRRLMREYNEIFDGW